MFTLVLIELDTEATLQTLAVGMKEIMISLELYELHTGYHFSSLLIISVQNKVIKILVSRALLLNLSTVPSHTTAVYESYLKHK